MKKVLDNCVFCGQRGEALRPITFSNSFTAYQFLQAGSGACPQCFKLFQNPKTRKTSWILHGEDGEIRELEHPLETLLNPPNPPFFIYLTKQKRKHGWIRVINYPALNRDKFIIAYEENRVLIDRQRLAKLVEFARRLRSRNIPVNILLSGNPSASQVRRFKLTREEIDELKTMRGDFQWEIAEKFSQD